MSIFSADWTSRYQVVVEHLSACEWRHFFSQSSQPKFGFDVFHGDVGIAFASAPRLESMVGLRNPDRGVGSFPKLQTEEYLRMGFLYCDELKSGVVQMKRETKVRVIWK